MNTLPPLSPVAIGIFFALAAGFSSAMGTEPCDQALLTSRRQLSSRFSPRGNRVSVAAFDAHKTLYVTQSGQITPPKEAEVELLPGVVALLEQLQNQGYLIALFSNQPGIDIQQSNRTLSQVSAKLNSQGVTVHYWDFPGQQSLEAKPSAQMFYRLVGILTQRGWTVDTERSFMVGDQACREKDGGDGDRGFAKSAGIRFYDPADYFGWRELGVRRFLRTSDVSVVTDPKR